MTVGGCFGNAGGLCDGGHGDVGARCNERAARSDQGRSGAVLLRGVTDTPGRGRLLLRHAVLLLGGHKEGIEIHERGLAQVRRVCIFVIVYSHK